MLTKQDKNRKEENVCIFNLPLLKSILKCNHS